MSAKESGTYQQRLAERSIEKASEGVFRVKSSGFFQQANRWFCELPGYSGEELQSLHICDITTDLSKAQWPELWQQLREQESLRHEGSLATKSQDMVAVEIKGSLLMFGGEELMCGFVREISSRNQETETLMGELKASEARFRTLYNNTPVMLQACDYDTRIYSVNGYWLETPGYEWEEVK